MIFSGNQVLGDHLLQTWARSLIHSYGLYLSMRVFTFENIEDRERFRNLKSLYLLKPFDLGQPSTPLPTQSALYCWPQNFDLFVENCCIFINLRSHSTNQIGSSPLTKPVHFRIYLLTWCWGQNQTLPLFTPFISTFRKRFTLCLELICQNWCVPHLELQPMRHCSELTVYSQFDSLCLIWQNGYFLHQSCWLPFFQINHR